MSETLNIISERVDDIPLLLAQLERMGVQPLRDEHCPTHGHWVGLSLGWVTVLWLTHILSEADHRLNHVEPWAEQRLHPLRGSTGPRVHPLDLSDDRLAAVLDALSDDECWQAFESALNQQLLRVYDLRPEYVRLDSTTASGYWSVTEEGLFQFWHSKDHRPDLPQVKVMRSALDPLGLPVATDVVPGQRADDPLYVPAITRVRASLGRRGLLYVGDCKMAALETRAFLQTGGDSYLCPLAESQLPPDVLEGYLVPVQTGQQPLTRITRVTAAGTPAHIADGYERLEPLSAVGAGAALNARRRGKPRCTERPALQEAAEAILTRYQVQGLLAVRYTERVQEHPLRRYGSRPATVRVERDVRVSTVVDRRAVAAAVSRLGWRVYATNTPPHQRPLSHAMLAYRSQYLVESGMGRLKGRPLSLAPMYLERDDHATGLIRLLSVGSRVLTLLECVVRRRLATARVGLAGLYAGNPKRATARPTAERLLERFQGLTLTIIREGRRRRYHLTPLLTPLSTLHRSILGLLDFPVDIYTRLCPDSHKPP